MIVFKLFKIGALDLSWQYKWVMYVYAVQTVVISHFSVNLLIFSGLNNAIVQIFLSDHVKAH